MTASTNLVLKPFGEKAFSERSFISEEEIKLLIEEGTDRGIFEPTEHELIHSVFRFTDISVKGVMVPVTAMVAFNINASQDVIIKTISSENFSRYPVYGRDKSDIKGILYNKDVFNELAYGRTISIPRILHNALFVPETMKISSLMREMQKKRQHMAIVIDEYGGVTGLVTIEDLIEEIVGEIEDEHEDLGGRWGLQLLESAEMGVADEASFLLVPEAEPQGFETGEQSDRGYGLEDRVGVVARFQVVIWDAGAEVVDVMVADVAAEPLENAG